MALSGGRKQESKVLGGRGGAGNFAARSPALEPADLRTPTIKSDLYTTGRGGTGNMALNLHSHPELARASQDVEAPQMSGREPETSVHYGRGGAANVARISNDAKAGARARNESRERAEAKAAAAAQSLNKEQRDRLSTEAAERERGNGSGSGSGSGSGNGKGKGVVQQGFEKLTRVMSSSGQSKK